MAVNWLPKKQHHMRGVTRRCACATLNLLKRSYEMQREKEKSRPPRTPPIVVIAEQPAVFSPLDSAAEYAGNRQNSENRRVEVSTLQGTRSSFHANRDVVSRSSVHFFN
jgi:hypothetical protein